MVNWTDTKATFAFLYDSLELTILFGDEIGKLCIETTKMLCSWVWQQLLGYQN